jgi:hypothetical protein
MQVLYLISFSSTVSLSTIAANVAFFFCELGALLFPLSFVAFAFFVLSFVPLA